MEKKLNQEFVDSNERRCPYCGAEDPELIVDEDLMDGTWAYSYECQTCGGEFDEIYSKIWVYDHYYSYPNEALMPKTAKI